MELPRQRIGKAESVPVYWKARNTHCFISGKSGEGKSVLMLEMWHQDHMYKNAKILIDASGSLARQAYSACKGKALYCSKETPININPLMSVYDTDTKVSLIVEAINQACSPTKDSANKDLTVKMFSILDEEIKRAIQNNRLSLLAVKDYIINRKGDVDTRDGLIHRLNFVLSDDSINKIICGTSDPLKWGELIDNRQTFILDTFGMSREKTIFCGNLVTQGLKNYFRYERRDKYKPVSIYVDECHLFTNPYWFDILKEGRKYNISAILATQDFSLLSETMRRILLNVGTLIAFRAGHIEATALAKEMDFRPQDIQFIDKYHCAYSTTESRGFCKVPRPPIFKKLIPTRPVQEIKANGWFNFVSYQTAEPQ